MPRSTIRVCYIFQRNACTIVKRRVGRRRSARKRLTDRDGAKKNLKKKTRPIANPRKLLETTLGSSAVLFSRNHARTLSPCRENNDEIFGRPGRGAEVTFLNWKRRRRRTLIRVDRPRLLGD